MTQTYLDNASTTKVDEKVLKTMIPYFSEKYGNASSLHFAGEESRREIEESRETIAKSIGASHSEILFTGSGTEANNFALKWLFWHNKKNNTGKNHIITTKIEHDCVLNTCKWLKTQGAEITYLDVDSEGFVDLKQLENSITEKTFVVSIIHGNNEIGTIQDLEKISKICKEKNVLFHTDACQSFTKAPINVKKQNIDLMTINAHKIHGPKGVGALYLNKPIKNQIIPLLHGGGQEFQLRSSTENVAGILGFAKAVKIASNRDVKNMTKLRDYFIKELLEIPNTELNGPKQNRLCNNINLSFKNIEGEAIGSYLNAKQIFVSTGSACSSKSLEASHVIKAIGREDEYIHGSIRFSLGHNNNEKQIKYIVKTVSKIVEQLRMISPIYDNK